MRDPAIRRSLLALSAALLVWGPRASADCGESQDLVVLLQTPGFDVSPLEVLAADPKMTDECKRLILSNLAAILQTRYQNGLCARGRCAGLQEASRDTASLAISSPEPLCRADSLPKAPCRINDADAARLGRAQPSVMRVADEGIDAIMSKISRGEIPYCLMPRECWSDDHQACRDYLRFLFWFDVAQTRRGHETWLAPGAFTHLALGQGFTCGSGIQNGGTCAIYSAASAVSHYCATPIRNPQASSECGPPDGVQCATPGDFLQRAFRMGCWTARECRPGRPGRPCVPVLADLTREERAELTEEMNSLHCGRTAARTPQCTALAQRLHQAPAGALLSCLRGVYRSFGFRSVFFPATEEGWTRARAWLLSGHPVQVHISPEHWSQYGPGMSEHAVVLEAIWTDQRGIERVLVRDSNNPNIVVLPAREVSSTYLARGGGVGLCMPGDTARCPEQ